MATGMVVMSVLALRPAPPRILDLHAVLGPQHVLLDFAQFAAVFDHVVVSDGDHPLALHAHSWSRASLLI